MADEFTVIANKPTITKDPNAVLDYYENFTNWLPEGDLIVSVTTIATGITVDEANITGAGKFVQLWCSGGTLGVTGTVTVRITTVEGRIDDRTLYFKMKAR